MRPETEERFRVFFLDFEWGSYLPEFGRGDANRQRSKEQGILQIELFSWNLRRDSTLSSMLLDCSPFVPDTSFKTVWLV